MTRNQTISTSTDRVSGMKVVPIPRMTLNEPAGEWRDSVLKRLEELIRLEIGWDGYQGKPVSFENATFALRMLEAVCIPETPAPQIVPGAVGDLQIEWHTLNGDVELHVRAPNKVHAWRHMVGHKQDGEEAQLTNVFFSVATWVKEVTESSIAPSAAAA